MKNIGAAIRSSSLDFAQSRSQLQMTNNTLYRLGISASLADTLRTVTPTAKKSLSSVFRRSFISDNEFLGGNNIFVMEHESLKSNSFEAEGRNDAGNVVALRSIYVGNFAPNDIRLFNAAQANQKAANLIINIVDI
jgi:hypothetical protein